MEPRVSIITLGVADLERSFHFYRDGLKLPTSRSPEGGIIFFQTQGVTLALYPYQDLADDINIHPWAQSAVATPDFQKKLQWFRKCSFISKASAVRADETERTWQKQSAHLTLNP